MPGIAPDACFIKQTAAGQHAKSPKAWFLGAIGLFSQVRLRQRWCAQACGIAQGSTLSTLLCRQACVAGLRDEQRSRREIAPIRFGRPKEPTSLDCPHLTGLELLLPCSLYLAHLERTRLAPLLQLPGPAEAGAPAVGQGPVPPQQAAGGAGAAGSGPAGRAATWQAADTATPADRLVGGVPTVVCLSEGEGAALCPATVLAATPSGAGASGGSKGLLTELAKAAESLATAPSASQATLQTGGQPLRHTRRRPASAGSSGGGSGGGGSSSRGAQAASGADLTGDLLLLPAGATPAGPAAAAAAAAATAGTSVRGGIASPVTVGTTGRQQRGPGSAGAAGAAGAAGGGVGGRKGSPRSTRPTMGAASKPAE